MTWVSVLNQLSFKSSKLTSLAILQLKFPNGTLMETRTMNDTVQHTILSDLLRDKPPENVTMPNNITISLDWSMIFGLVPTAIVISSSDSKNATMLFEQCINVDEMGIFYADAYFDPDPRSESGGDWFASGDYRHTDPTRQKLLTKYPSARCLNRYMLGLQDLFQRPNYTPNMTWWTDENNFRCLPSTDYAWVSSRTMMIVKQDRAKLIVVPN